MASTIGSLFAKDNYHSDKKPDSKLGTRSVQSIDTTAQQKWTDHALTALKTTGCALKFFAKIVVFGFGIGLFSVVAAVPTAVRHIYEVYQKWKDPSRIDLNKAISNAKMKNYESARLQKNNFNPDSDDLLASNIGSINNDPCPQMNNEDDREALFNECFNQLPKSVTPKQVEELTYQIYALVDETLEIEKMIREGKCDAREIYTRIDALMGTSIYKRLAHGENPVIDYLKELAMLDLTVDGEEILKEFGKRIVGKLTEPLSFGKLATTMDTCVKNTTFNRDSLLGEFAYGITHLFEVIHNGHSNWFPEDYDAHLHNHSHRGPDFVHPTDTNKKMKFVYGPTPTSNVLEATEQTVCRFSLQTSSTHNGKPLNAAERTRIEELDKRKKINQLSFDIKETKKKEKEISFKNPTEYYESFKNIVMGTSAKLDTGYKFNDEDIRNEQLNKVFATSADIATKLSGAASAPNEFWTPPTEDAKGKLRLSKMLKLNFDAVAFVDIIYRKLEKKNCDKQTSLQEFETIADAQLDKEIVAAACKQNIDRAVVFNIASRLYFRLLSNSTPLTSSEVHSIIGAVIGRAEMVDGRAILWKRYEILSDLLKFIGTEQRMKVLSVLLRAHVGIKEEETDTESL